MADVWLHNVVKQFSSSAGSAALCLWQLKLIAKLCKIENLAMVLMLFLDSAALAVYKQLTEDKQDTCKIEAALVLAFNINKFQA
jgi:hypothetical protein